MHTQCDIDSWTDCIAGGQSTEQWTEPMAEAGFVDIEVGEPVDTFGGAPGEDNARRLEVFGTTPARPSELLTSGEEHGVQYPPAFPRPHR